jgi:hypothetical protein
VTSPLETFFGFILAGLVALLAYLLHRFEGEQFAGTMALALGTLFAAEAGRAVFTGRGWLVSGWRCCSWGRWRRS